MGKEKIKGIKSFKLFNSKNTKKIRMRNNILNSQGELEIKIKIKVTLSIETTGTRSN